jgi:hypothetical protein
MEDDGVFCGHPVHFTVFSYILWTFGIVRGSLVYFFPVLVFFTKKNLATLIMTPSKVEKVCPICSLLELPPIKSFISSPPSTRPVT